MGPVNRGEAASGGPLVVSFMKILSLKGSNNLPLMKNWESHYENNTEN